jgi:hypothetical protein
MLNISLFTLEKIKKEAKMLKSQFPELSYGQRLNIASQKILNVRGYHEAVVLCKKHVDSFVNQVGEFAECSYCNLSFIAKEKEDIKIHEARHLEYEKAEYELGFLPAPYKIREANKKNAYKKLDTDNPASVKMDGALQLIRAHFDRSLESAIDGEYWREHPTFEEYVAMVNDYNAIPPDIMNQIRNKFGKILGQINPGESYWFPSKIRHSKKA